MYLFLIRRFFLTFMGLYISLAESVILGYHVGEGNPHMENLMKHKWILIILIIAIVVIIWRFTLNKESDDAIVRGTGRMMQAIPVEVSPVKIMDLTDSSSLSGNIEARSSYIVAPKTSGQLVKLHVNIGQVVRKGDLIAELDDRLLLQELQKASAAVEMARASSAQSAVALEFATTELERKRELHTRAFISQSEFDTAYNQFTSAKAQDNIAKASLNSAIATMNSVELQIAFSKIRAEWNDNSEYRVIGERFAEEGTQLNTGSPIVSIMDISSVIVAVDVIERDYGRIKLGQEAVVRSDSYPDQVFSGKVLRIAPMLQQSTRQARVEIGIPNPKGLLKPGMYARVALSFDTRKNVTAVEERAIVKLRGKEGVYLVDRDQSNVAFIEIERGISGDDHVEIISPALSGEVVSLGQDMLDDGRKIIVAGEAKQRGSK